MSRFCIDTSAYSQFKRGHREVAELLDSANYISVPSIVIGELWLGFLGGARASENELEFNQFFEHPVSCCVRAFISPLFCNCVHA